MEKLKSVWIAAGSGWHAAASGLKPLRLLRAQINQDAPSPGSIISTWSTLGTRSLAGKTCRKNMNEVPIQPLAGADTTLLIFFLPFSLYETLHATLP